MDQNTMYIIAGVSALLLIIIVFLIIRKKKSKQPKIEEQNRQMVEQVSVGSKYNGRELSDEEMESAPRLELISFNDGINALVLRFEIKGGTIKIDDIEPYDNNWGFVHNYNEIIGQNRHHGQHLRLFFNRRKRKTANTNEAFNINIVYRDANEVQWLQPLRYRSNRDVKVKDVKILAGEALPENAQEAGK